MKFVFEYRTSDNVKHNGVVAASCKDAAYALLKTRGIRPSALYEAPGFFNKLFGKCKRWLAIAFLLVVSVSLAFALFQRKSNIGASLEEVAGDDRHQIYGDDAIIAEGIKTGWRGLLDNPGDRILALYVQPGVVVPRIWGQKGITEQLLTTFESKMRVEDADLLEYKQVKSIVLGLRKEFGEYLQDGGSAMGFLERLEERQNLEASIYRRLEKELGESAGTEGEYAMWQSKNAELRALGIRTIPLPKGLQEE